MEQIVDIIWNTGVETLLCFVAMVVLCVLIDVFNITDLKRRK